MPGWKTHLVLYLDQGTTLSLFRQIGIFDREMAVFRQLAATGMPVTILSWGRGEDAALVADEPGIAVEENLTGGRNRPWMVRHLARWKPSAGEQAVVMTNQMFGAELAVLACCVGRHPLVLRCGFLLSEHIEMSRGRWSLAMLRERLRERFVLPFCSAIVVTSDRMRQVWCSRYPGIENRIHVIPNYVDESVFRPLPDKRDGREAGTLDLIFTGRLADQKNLDILIEAVRRSPGTRLRIIGLGPEEDRLHRLAESCAGRVTFLGMVDNHLLADHYADSDVFVLPSHYEGNPKALLEAMACGLPVIGTAVQGIADAIDDGTTGLLVEPSADALVAAIGRLQDPALRRTLGQNAREKVLAQNGLQHYAAALRTVLEDVAAGARGQTG